MKAARLLVWLVALVALIVPPVAAGHATTASPVASAHCADHAPPPAPCPDHGTAKHAAGDCCSAMAPMMALVPAASSIDAESTCRLPRPDPVADFVGRTLTKDPPPPRA
jgi:hypothetical protein